VTKLVPRTDIFSGRGYGVGGEDEDDDAAPLAGRCRAPGVRRQLDSPGAGHLVGVECVDAPGTWMRLPETAAICAPSAIIVAAPALPVDNPRGQHLRAVHANGDDQLDVRGAAGASDEHKVPVPLELLQDDREVRPQSRRLHQCQVHAR